MSKSSSKTVAKAAPVEVEDVSEKKDGMNADTRESGLFFNVNAYRAFLSEKVRELMKSDQLAAGTQATDDKFKISGSHVALGAANEVLLTYLIENGMNHTTKSSIGLYELTSVSFRAAVTHSAEFAEMFGQYVSKYDSDMTYTSAYPVDVKRVNQYIENRHGNNVRLVGDAFNFVAFLLLRFCNIVVRDMYILTIYKGSKSLSEKQVKCALRLRVPSTLYARFVQRIDDADTRLEAWKKSKAPEKKDDEPAASAPSKDSKKSSKSDTTKSSKSKKDESESEASDDSDAESEDEASDAESSDSESEEVVPVKKGKSGKSASK